MPNAELRQDILDAAVSADSKDLAAAVGSVENANASLMIEAVT